MGLPWVLPNFLLKVPHAGPKEFGCRKAFTLYVSDFPIGRDGAAYVTRTRDPIITNDVLYQLS